MLPSRIVADLHPAGNLWLILVGMRAFELSLFDCKGAEGWSPDGTFDAAVFDAYFVPLIEAARPRWDR